MPFSTQLIRVEKNIIATPGGKTPTWPRYTTRTIERKNGLLFFFFRRFWVKEPRHSGNIFAKKRYTSIVACVIYHTAFSLSSHAQKPLNSLLSACTLFFFATDDSGVVWVLLSTRVKRASLSIISRIDALAVLYCSAVCGPAQQKSYARYYWYMLFNNSTRYQC